MSDGRIMRLIADHSEKIRFLVVGAINTVLSVAIYNAMLTAAEWLSADRVEGSAGRYVYLVVFWVSWVLMVVVSTTTMKYFAFRSPGQLGPQVLKAYAVYLPAQGLSTLILWASVDVLGLSPRVGQLVAIGVTTVFSYLGHKHFTFRAPVELDEALEPHDTPHVGESL